VKGEGGWKVKDGYIVSRIGAFFPGIQLRMMLWQQEHELLLVEDASFIVASAFSKVF